MYRRLILGAVVVALVVSAATSGATVGAEPPGATTSAKRIEWTEASHASATTDVDAEAWTRTLTGVERRCDLSGPESRAKRAPLVTAAVERVEGADNRFRITYRNAPAQFAVRVPRRTTLVSTTGFEATKSRWLRRIGDGDPTLTYEYNLSGPPSTSTAKLTHVTDFGAGENWSLGPVPLRYRHARVEYRTVGPGVVNGRTAFLGEYARYSRTRDCRTIEIVVPRGVGLGPDPEQILDALVYADRRIGDHAQFERVTGFVSPARMTRGGYAVGSQFVVGPRAAGRTDARAAIWVHEFVHVRQRLRLAEDMEWYREASAEYLGLRFAAESGLISEREYVDAFRRHERRASTEAVLTEPSTWRGGAEYSNGALALAALDARIRDRTGGSATFVDVFDAVNRHGVAGTGKLSYARFLVAVESTTEPARRWPRTYVVTTPQRDVRMMSGPRRRYRRFARAQSGGGDDRGDAPARPHGRV